MFSHFHIEIYATRLVPTKFCWTTGATNDFLETSLSAPISRKSEAIGSENVGLDDDDVSQLQIQLGQEDLAELDAEFSDFDDSREAEQQDNSSGNDLYYSAWKLFCRNTHSLFILCHL